MAKLSASLTEEAVPVMKLTSWENPLLFHPQLNATLGLEYIRRYNIWLGDYFEGFGDYFEGTTLKATSYTFC